MTKFLVTGASGFVGANFVRKLVSDENEITVFLRKNSNLWRIQDIIPKINVRIIDMSNFNQVKTSLKEINPELVYHCAGHGIYPSQKNSAEIFSTNILGTFNLLNALNENNNLRRLVNLGSFFEYLTNPTDPYTISKITQTKLVEHFFKEKKLPAITLRLFTPYGKFDSPGRLICDLMIALIRNKPLEIFSRHTKRDFIHIDDVITALEIASQQPDITGEIIDIGTGNEISVEEIVSMSNQLSDNELIINWNDTKQHEADILDGNIFLGRQQTQTLNWNPSISLETGLRKTIEWYKQNINLYNIS